MISEQIGILKKSLENDVEFTAAEQRLADHLILLEDATIRLAKMSENLMMAMDRIAFLVKDINKALTKERPRIIRTS